LPLHDRSTRIVTVRLFASSLHDEFASWATGYVSCGGADLGEIEAIAAAVHGSSDQEFFQAWSAASDRHAEAGSTAAKAGHRATACGHYLRAAAYLTVAYHPLYGFPVDPRLAEAFERQMAAFGRAAALADPAVEPVALSFEGHAMPAYFARARGAAEGERRPLVVLTNGYDATVVDMYVASARAIVDRGYHCLFFDGPGQGALLVREGVAMVPDWERVVTPVIDAALARPDVDADRVVLWGWSLGGYLALRAATGEHRLAACVADPGLASVRAGIVGLATQLGMSGEAVAALPEISDADQTTLRTATEANDSLRWKIVQRGFWVNGVENLRDYLASAWKYDLDGRQSAIDCPVLATAAEDDPLARGATDLVASLRVPSTVIPFSSVDGAGDHCEMQNRWLANQRILDWLDGTLGVEFA
jgi:dienelactone hydrolase